MTQNSNMPIIARPIYIQEIHIGFKNAGLLISTVCNHFSGVQIVITRTIFPTT